MATKKHKEISKKAGKATVPSSEKSDKRLMAICLAVIAITTYFVFSPSLQNDFTNWDDELYVLNNHLVVSNSIDIAKIFSNPVAANYHPLTILSLSINYQDGKLDPSGYHFENVILHLLNTILVFFFIYLLTKGNLLMSSVVSLFFGIHPMHVESVSWVSERKDVLYVFFFIAGLITYLFYLKKKKLIWFGLTLLLFILSCLSKGMAVVFPLVLFLIDYLKGVKWNAKAILEKIPIMAIAMFFGIVAIKVQSGVAIASMQTFTLVQRLIFVSYGAIMYIAKFFVPQNLVAFYPYPNIFNPHGLPLIYYLSPVILLALIALIIYCYVKKEKEIVFGLLFYFAGVVLVLQFITVGQAIIADRYSYLSYIGLLFVVAYLINKVRLSKDGLKKAIKYPVLLVLIITALLFSVEAYSRAQVWKNSETLWTDEISKYPNSSVGWEHLADYYGDNNDYKKALAFYNKAVLFDRYNKNAVYDRGLLFENHFNKKDSALIDFTNDIQLDPNFPTVYNERGSVYFAMGKLDSALLDISKAIELDPSFAQYYYNRALCLMKMGDYGKAGNDFNQSLKLNPKSSEAFYANKGKCDFYLKKYNEKIDDFTKAILLNPSGISYWYNRAIAERKVGQNDNADADELKAQRLQGK